MFNLAMRSIFRKKKEPLFGNRFDTMFKKKRGQWPRFFYGNRFSRANCVQCNNFRLNLVLNPTGALSKAAFYAALQLASSLLCLYQQGDDGRI